MYKVITINLGNFGSTGRIIKEIEYSFDSAKYCFYHCYPQREDNLKREANDIIICSSFWFKIARKLGKITGFLDCFNTISTRLLLRKIRRINPDIVHLHNLHGGYLNIRLLFKFLNNNKNTKVVWTFHDCWPFTGRCPHFVIEKCGKWENGCFSCCYSKNRYPEANVDNTKKLWKLKKELFSRLDNLTIVTPSNWLANLAKRSFFKNASVETINNGIDLNVFRPTRLGSNLRFLADYKFIILGVAFDWGYRKGLDVFIELSKQLDSDYQIVLVGTNETIDSLLPKNIISIHKTNSKEELAQLYSIADLFVNPTREDTFPTVNIESIACGTPVLTFKTGGSPEIINELCGSIVDCDDVENLKKEIIRICENRPFKSEDCLKRARIFDSKKTYRKYCSLYSLLLNKE